MPEMTDIATGRQPRPSDLDKFPAAFSVAGEKQEKAADKETSILLQRFSGNPDVKKARSEFERHKKSKNDSFMILMGSISPCDKGTDSWGILPTHESPPACDEQSLEGDLRVGRTICESCPRNARDVDRCWVSLIRARSGTSGGFEYSFKPRERRRSRRRRQRQNCPPPIPHCLTVSALFRSPP